MSRNKEGGDTSVHFICGKRGGLFGTEVGGKVAGRKARRGQRFFVVGKKKGEGRV